MVKVLTDADLERRGLSEEAHARMTIWLSILGFQGPREECGFIVTEQDDGSITFFASALAAEESEEDCTFRVRPDEWRWLSAEELAEEPHLVTH